jgi:hypothetical protein
MWRWFRWVLIVGILVIVIIAIVVLSKNEDNTESSKSAAENQTSNETYWRQTEDGWEAFGTPPACPESLVLSIADISKATSVLYPGQMRSVGYEPTAGFRFDNSKNNEAQVKAPLDGEIIQAARFYEKGQIQYVFDILSPCGIMNRFDHLLEIPLNLQTMADKLPAPKEGDTRSNSINPPVKVAKGDIIATAVGNTNNTYISWTVFDFRKKNKSSEDKSWAAEHQILYHYAICPFQYMTDEDQTKVKSLPPTDSTSGSKSDFCNGIWP